MIPPADPRSKSNDDGAQRDELRQRPATDGYVEIPLEAIAVNQSQPRKVFEDDALRVLADSIRRFGVLQPVVVRPSDGDKPYELIAGERRWRASGLAGKLTVPAIVRNSDEESSLVEALVENLHRQDLNPLEEAAAFRQLLDDFGVTHSQLGERLGKGRATISNSIRLLELPADAQGAIAEGKITAGHARALLACSSSVQQTNLLNKNFGWKRFSPGSGDIRKEGSCFRGGLSRKALELNAASFSSGSTKSAQRLPKYHCKCSIDR